MNMTTYIVAFFLPLLFALAATPLVRRLALSVGAVDQPGERRIHLTPIPRMGGLAVAFAFASPLVGLFFYGQYFENRISNAFYADQGLVLGLVVGCALILALGVYDDIKGARPLLKILVQCLVAVVCFKLGYRIEFLSNPFGIERIGLNVLSLPLTIIWVVGIVNAVNLIDGIDGLASGVAFFACVTLFTFSASAGNMVAALITAALAGAILGFLVFNFHPATIFLGDTGSMFLGFVLAVTSISCTVKQYTAFSILLPALALGVPILDTALAMIRRALTGKPIMSADRHHIHHRLLQRGLSQRQVALTLYAFCAGLALVSIAAAYLNNGGLLLVLFVGLVGAIVVLMRYMGYIQLIRDERRGQAHRELLTSVSEHIERLASFRHSLHGAKTLEEIWQTLLELRAPFGLIAMHLELTHHPLIPHPRVWETEQRGSLVFGDSTGTLLLTLGPSEAPIGQLQVFWTQENTYNPPELHRLYFELVRSELNLALARVSTQAPRLTSSPAVNEKHSSPPPV